MAEDNSEVHGEVVKCGYLVKSPPQSRAPVAHWHKRWFLLMDSKLVYPMGERYVRMDYYQSEADAKRLADPKGNSYLVCSVEVGGVGPRGLQILKVLMATWYACGGVGGSKPDIECIGVGGKLYC